MAEREAFGHSANLVQLMALTTFAELPWSKIFGQYHGVELLGLEGFQRFRNSESQDGFSDGGAIRALRNWLLEFLAEIEKMEKELAFEWRCDAVL